MCTSKPVKLGGLADRCGYGPRLRAMAVPLTWMFDFSHPKAKPVKLDPKTGAVVG